jgi:hypothetical protein
MADRCSLCYASAKRHKYLTLSLGNQVYLALPERASVAAGHVLICTVEHEPSFRAADEDAFEELTNFRKCLIQMFAKQVWKKKCTPCRSQNRIKCHQMLTTPALYRPVSTTIDMCEL